jgi:hypothetical protein
MRSAQLTLFGVILGAVALLSSACGGSGSGAAGSGSGFAETYQSVNEEEAVTLKFSSDGKVVLSAEAAGSSNGTYTVDGEKLLLNLEGQHRTFIRDGSCIEDPQDVIGKLCKGGKTGEASNVSTRNVPTTPSGSYFAKNADGEFLLEFKSGNKFSLTATPTGGQLETQDGTFTMEGDVIYATLPQAVPLVLKFVNDGYESTSFGFPMKFQKK